MSLQRNDFLHDAHRRFITRIVAAKQVWGLHNDEGWAAADSNHDPDRRVIPFWSDEAYARRCAKGVWMKYQPTAIPLDKFLEKWLPGMDLKGQFAGTNWDGKYCGVEIYPLPLKEQIEDELKKQASGEPPPYVDSPADE